MNLRKIIATGIAAISVLTMFFCLSAHAEMTRIEWISDDPKPDTTVTPGSGQCGANAYWELSEDGTLTISGSGSVYNYYKNGVPSTMPWIEENSAAEIKRLVIEEGIEDLSGVAFYDTSITSLELPDGVTAIGEAAFGGCRELITAVLPESITEIPTGAFNCCDLLETVVLPQGLKSIKESAFIHCYKLKNIVIPKTVTEIKFNAFFDCPALEEVVISDPIKTIERFSFDECISLKNVIFPPGLTKVEEAAFSNCANLEEIILPDSLIEIGQFAFSYSEKDRDSNLSKQKVYVPKGVKTIGRNGIDRDSVIYGFKNSTAEKYAKENNNEFVEVSESMYNAENFDEAKAAYYSKDLQPKSKTLVINSGNRFEMSIDGKVVGFEYVMPFVDSKNRTHVPIRAIAEMLDCTVDWNAENQTVSITGKDGDNILITIDSDVMLVNGAPVQMDTAALIWHSRTYIPLRFAAEALGLTVQWI